MCTYRCIFIKFYYICPILYFLVKLFLEKTPLNLGSFFIIFLYFQICERIRRYYKFHCFPVSALTIPFRFLFPVPAPTIPLSFISIDSLIEASLTMLFFLNCSFSFFSCSFSSFNWLFSTSCCVKISSDDEINSCSS